MKVCIAAPQIVNLVGGGLSTQIDMTVTELRRLGIDVTFHDQWQKHKPNDFDLLHVFRADIGTMGIVRCFYDAGVPVLVSPVYLCQQNRFLVKTQMLIVSVFHRLIPHFRSDFEVLADICSMASAVIPNTKEEADFFIDSIGVDRKKISIIPNAVEERFQNGDPLEFKTKFSIESDFVLAIGGLGAKRKNMLNFIKAMKIAGLPAVILGESSANEYGRICQSELERTPNVRLINHLPHSGTMLESAYSACRVFAMPSYLETPGIAAMEAALTGAALVITPNGGTQEYFEEMAIYTDPKSPTKIAADILTAWNNDNDPQKLREHLRSKYSWSRVAESTLTVYRKILGK